MEHPFQNLPFILVTGRARSGTTILTRAIGAHPLILSNQKESTYIRDLLELIKSNLTSPSRIRQMPVTSERFVESFRTALYNVLFPRNIIESEGFSAAPENGIKPIATSTFSSTKSGLEDFVEVLFPDFMIVNIVRNGTEVVSSRMNHHQIGKRTFQEHCIAWAEAKEIILWAMENRNFFLVRHENLLDEESNEATFEKFFEWSGIPAAPDCAQYVMKTRINTTQHSDETTETGANLTARSERWRSWSTDQRSMFEDICGETMDFLGYEIPW